MAVVIELNPSPEQREELARGYIERLGREGGELGAYEIQTIAEIISGRAVTVGRFQVIKEAAERILGVTKC